MGLFDFNPLKAVSNILSAGVVMNKEISEEELEKDLIGINFEDQEDNPLKKVCATGLINADIDKVWEVISEYGKYERFMPRVKYSKVTNQTETSLDVHIKLDVPWPFKETHYTNQHDHSEKYKSSWKMLEGTIKDNFGDWVLEPYKGDKSRTLAKCTIVTDPGMAIPSKLIDMATSITVPDVIRAVRREVKERFEL